PDVDHIAGLSPAISIEQKSTSHNPRSTVGTVTEIYDYLRLLFARIGTPHCPTHKLPLNAQTITQMVDMTLELSDEKRLMLISPIIRNRKGEHAKLFDELKAQGFLRVRIDGGSMRSTKFPRSIPSKITPLMWWLTASAFVPILRYVWRNRLKLHSIFPMGWRKLSICKVVKRSSVFPPITPVLSADFPFQSLSRASSRLITLPVLAQVVKA